MFTRIPTFAGLIKRQLEYREENVFGEGIDISSGTLKSAGHIKSIDPKIEIVLEEFRRLGSEDIYKSIKLAENYRFTVTYAIEDIEFLKYGINSQGSSNSIDKSLALGFSYMLNGVEHFVRIKGARMNSIELKANADSLIEVTSEFICKEISTPNTTDYVSGTATHATDLTNNPWHFADATDPVRLVSGASTTILPCTSLTIKINRNLDPIRTLGSQQITFLPATNRDITGSITLLYLSTSREVDLKSSNAYTLRWILKEGAGGAVLDLTNTVFTSLDKREFNASDNKAILETLGFRAKGATIYTT
jgi:hypothetical protein